MDRIVLVAIWNIKDFIFYHKMHRDRVIWYKERFEKLGYLDQYNVDNIAIMHRIKVLLGREFPDVKWW